jgi:hypothetical protein
MGLTENEFWAALWLIVGGAVIGAKSLFVALGWPHFASGAFTCWRKLNFWRGTGDFGIALPFGHAIGHAGGYSHGCCAGRTPHPVQRHESAGLLLIASLTDRVLRAVNANRAAHGTAFCTYGRLSAALRLALDPLTIDGRLERCLGLSHQQSIGPRTAARGRGGYRLVAPATCDSPTQPILISIEHRPARAERLFPSVDSVIHGAAQLISSTQALDRRNRPSPVCCHKTITGAGPSFRQPQGLICRGGRTSRGRRCRPETKPDSWRTAGPAAHSR